MSSGFNAPGNYGFLSNVASSVKSNPGDWLLYAFAALIIFVIGMMLSQVKIDFSWLDPRPKRMIVTSNSELFWQPSSRFVNLTVPSDSIKHPLGADSYSMTVETVLYNTRNYNSTEGPYRHIVHRGSDELATASVGGAIVSGCAAVYSSNLPPFGLPKRLNPGIFLDPNTNDILVFVDTHLGAENYRESVRIADIPLDIPFRLGVVLSGRVLEVYLNCRLEVTKVLTGEPKTVESDWYGLSGSAAAQAQIQNLYLWNKPLIADEIKPLCAAFPTFPKVRPICAGADSVIASPATQGTQGTQGAQGTQIDLGFGAQINTCST
jgi:hypothetical protein